MFGVSDAVQGRIFLDCNLPEVSRSTRQSIYQQMIAALAQLHATDVQTAGLQGYGVPAHYCRCASRHAMRALTLRY